MVEFILRLFAFLLISYFFLDLYNIFSNLVGENDFEFIIDPMSGSELI